MASSLPETYTYPVFTSFHGPDIRKTFLSHLRKQFNYNGILMFDQWNERRQSIFPPDFIHAIRESRISIVLLTERYASSSWCLDELLEILECRKEFGQIVMTVFYGVDPSDVRKQTGDFGIAFHKMCVGKTNEQRRNWSKALTYAGSIAGEDFKNWDNEAEMIEKIAKHVLDKLNVTLSRDFDGMIGLDAHLKEMESLLDLGNEEVKMVAITGPAGIGKTTIARALQCRLSERFQLTCFVDNPIGSYPSDFDEYSLKLRLQEEFLSKILNHNGLGISHLGAIKERLGDRRVLIILDDVKDIKQLEALANETTWFGPGSRIVIATENIELLQQHGISNKYHVRFPSDEEAFQIFCKYAFGQSSPPNEFNELAENILNLCGNLPLGLREVGSSFRGKEGEWEDVMNRLETMLYRAFEGVEQICYEPSSPNKPIGKSKSRCSIGMAFLVVINLLLEIASAVADQLSSIRKPYFARVSLVMSFLSFVLSIFDLTFKIRAHKARFRCKWPVPWFYYPELDYHRIFGSFTDTTLLFCVVGQLIVSGINWYFIERRVDGPIKVSVWPLVFAIGIVVGIGSKSV